MKFNKWLSSKKMSQTGIRKMKMSNEKWNELCKEYEMYCLINHLKVDYGLFDK